MRIKRKIQLAGLVVALAGGVTGTAHAGNRTVDDDITTPLTTSNPDGSAVAGDITVGTEGSITVDANETAITVDSSNNVLVEGVLASLGADNSRGITIQGGNAITGNTITNSGTISLVEEYTPEDLDDDGNLDEPMAIGTNRHGIFLEAGPTFNGNIIHEQTIVVEGNDSSGITLNGHLNGTLDASGGIGVTGTNSVGIAINGGVTGDVFAHGAMTIRGENSVGLLVDSNITGELSISGNWTVTGYNSILIPADQGTLDADDLLQSGSAVQISGNVVGGVTLEGVGVENDEDDDDDGELNEADDGAGVAIVQFGTAPGVHVFADGSNVAIGAGSTGYGLNIRGGITANSVFDGITATALAIEGDGLGATATVDGGILVDSSIVAVATEADAMGIRIGQDADVDEIHVRGNVTTSVQSDAAVTNYGILIESGGDTQSIVNSGLIITNYFGETGTAVGITDLSGTLTSITNSGIIAAAVVATDDDLTDDIPPPPVTGSAIAIDVSASAANVTLTQIEPVPFTDDDAIDNILANDPRITGDILFGSGNNTIDLLFGTITGDVSFGDGDDVFNIDNGAIYTGRITDTDGLLTFNITDGQLNLQGGQLNIDEASFGANSLLSVLLSDVPVDSTLITSSGTVTFAAGAEILPVVPTGLPTFGSHVFLQANGGLFGASNVVGTLTGPDVPFLYTISIETTLIAPDGAPNGLQAVFDLKTPVELGLSANQTIAFLPILDALRLDDAAAAAMAGITTEYEFFDAYEDLLPNYGPGATEIATTAIQQMQSATSNRMAATRLQGLDEVSVWAQEIAYGVERAPPNSNAQEFRGHGFGFAAGIDGPTDNGGIFGLSLSFVTSEVEEPGRPDGEISTWLGQVNAYYGTALGPVDLDFILGGGGGQMQSRRFVEIGNPVTFSALSEGDWWAYEGHGSARASLPLSAGWFVVTPQAALTYVGMGEQGYTESGGGPAIDYIVDDVFTQRLWGDVGLELSAKWGLGGQSVIAPRVYVGYRGNLLDDESERTVQFASGGAPFTLTDEGVGEGGPLFGIGIDATNGYSTFSIGYEGEFGDQIDRHSINAAIRFRF